MTASGPPDVETLLAHEGFVRGLARQLVTGDADVDDVVQQTFVAALEHPPRSEGGLRGWLATVVRNVVRQGYRAKGRRARRERVAARPEGVPSTADLLAREVARRTVVEAVVALDEPYRAAIVLRYLEGLPPRDVAARLGVPVETARTRVKRGLVLLRARLDERHRGDRRAWMAVVLPLAGPAAPPSSVGGAGARRGPVLVAAGLVIAVGGGAAWWAGAGSDESAPAPTPRTTAWLAPTRGPDADQAPPVPAPAPSLAPAPRPTAWVAAPRPAASLRGVVVGDGRRTVPGAEVRVAPEGPDGEVAAAAARTTRTDATGQFAFDGLAAGAWRVDVRAPDGRVATTSRAASAAGDATFVVVGPAAEAIVLGVHVEDAAGRPLAGAEVEVHLDDAPSASRRVVTGADGGATVEATATGPRVPGTLTARHRVGVALARFEVDRARDGVRPHVRLVVAAPATVEGRLTGPAGVDLDGTVVRVVPVGGGAGAATAVCVSVGDRFEGAGLPAGAYHLEVEPPAGTRLAADAAPVRV
ncbi:MAG: sigma-70 family RNA polymerase sigma factor, partial [Planctomycetia bacterium]|nr:sigma-70 family RNA polymerase sigma factor [Planctomycetia bacterium]